MCPPNAFLRSISPSGNLGTWARGSRLVAGRTDQPENRNLDVLWQRRPRVHHGSQVGVLSEIQIIVGSGLRNGFRCALCCAWRCTLTRISGFLRVSYK